MSTIEDIRHANLLLLIAEAGGQRALADRVSAHDNSPFAPAQISQWVTRAPSSRTGKPRVIHSNSARRLEASMRKPAGWMDQPHAATVAERLRLAREFRAWNREKLAEELGGVSVDRLADIESGTIEPTDGEIRAIGSTLWIADSWLRTGRTTPTSGGSYRKHPAGYPLEVLRYSTGHPHAGKASPWPDGARPILGDAAADMLPTDVFTRQLSSLLAAMPAGEREAAGAILNALARTPESPALQASLERLLASSTPKDQ